MIDLKLIKILKSSIKSKVKILIQEQYHVTYTSYQCWTSEKWFGTTTKQKIILSVVNWFKLVLKSVGKYLTSNFQIMIFQVFKKKLKKKEIHRYCTSEKNDQIIYTNNCDFRL